MRGDKWLTEGEEDRAKFTAPEAGMPSSEKSREKDPLIVVGKASKGVEDTDARKLVFNPCFDEEGEDDKGAR